MKRRLLPLLMIAGLLFIGCEKDQVDQLEDPGIDKAVKVVNAIQTLSSDITPLSVQSKSSSFDDDFEAANLWFAYYTAKTLKEDAGSRFFFGSVLSANNTVSASALLDDTYTNPFRNAFRDFVWSQVCAEIDCGRPDPPPLGGPKPPLNPNEDGGPVMGGDIDGQILTMRTGGIGIDDGSDDHGITIANQMTDAFIDYITNESCIELFLPNGIDYTTSKSYYAVSHPLNNNSGNLGLEYFDVPQVHDDGNEYEGGTKFINPALVNAGHVVIVSRPIDQPLVPGCGYSTYFGVSDFTLFLD
ncbi:hypothetical protein [Gilvibacter sp.]|uniref:hypothetical protein n=1 Tax=Gilvibacter sp. TaxID=2729997 RepID=UPI003F49B556